MSPLGMLRRNRYAGHAAPPELSAFLDSRSLVERIGSGDPAAEEEFIRRYHVRVVMMMRARMRRGGVAEDLAQETLVESLEALRRGAIHAPEKLAAFVHGTALNVLNGYRRYQGRHPLEVSLPEDLPDPRSPEETLENRETLGLLRRAFTEIPRRDRELLRMSLVEGFTPVEIAAAAGSGAGLIRVRKCRAARRLLRRFRVLTRRGRR